VITIKTLSTKPGAVQDQLTQDIDVLAVDLAQTGSLLQQPQFTTSAALIRSARALEQAIALRTGLDEMGTALQFRSARAMAIDDPAASALGLEQFGGTLAKESILALEEVDQFLQREKVVLRIEAKLLNADGASSDLRLFPYNDAAAEPVFKTAGVDWEDVMELRSFGWHNHFVGGIAFVQQDGESSWKPTPVASWTVVPRSGRAVDRKQGVARPASRPPPHASLRTTRHPPLPRAPYERL
jgi:hypothetical protein